jgi:hypothetical protein
MELKERIEQFLKITSEFLLSEQLKPTKEIIDNYYKRLSEPMQVAIIGKIKASKSTMVNAILEEDNLVQTGDMEVTYNVSWLKFDEYAQSIKVHFKDNTETLIDKGKWTEWANAQTKDEIKNKIAFMEIPQNNPVLEKINIIDTPGLLSGGIDAQNTIDFLSKKEHKPDAVVVLFAGSIHEDVASIVTQFQNHELNFTPLNTLGVLSKIDSYWKPEQNKLEYPMKKGLETCERLMSDANTKGLFYKIYPVNSLLSIASFSITQKDVELLKKLSELPLNEIESSLCYPTIFYADSKLPITPCVFYDEEKPGECARPGYNGFCKIYYRQSIDLGLDINCIRPYLYHKFDRFGIMLLCTYLKENPDARLEEIKLHLRQTSGYKNFVKVLRNHFGERATLIKMQSAISNLLSELKEESNRLTNENKRESAEFVNSIHTALLKEKEFDLELKLMEILCALYENKLCNMGSYTEICQEEIESDILHISGEFGSSLTVKLGLTEDVNIEGLKRIADEKIRIWRILAKNFHEDAVEIEYSDYAKVIYKTYQEIKNSLDVLNNKIDEYHKLLHISK